MIAKLTIEQHREIYGKVYADGMFFNPILDADGNILISEEEVKQLKNQDHAWVKDLELIEKDSQLKDLTKEEWLAEDKKRLEEELLKIEDKLKKK